ncbi:VanZ family protein [Actinomadura sp. HBU206391]|uniref:VanZ family protein n=1 Tax=Actinomadura sp. HBU206391 TaxID=2731692 RepID=UPI002905D923|nr:VanZ family protein [Actinomadura sp. HBU206391]
MPTSTTSRPSAKKKTEQTSWYVTPLRVVAIVITLGIAVVFSYWAAIVTLSPINDHGQAVGNTDAGHSLRFYLDQPSIKEAVRQLGGNLVLFAPLGILLPVLVSRLRGPLRLALVSGLISFAVEIAQGFMVQGRAFDIDDVILNTVGVVLAYLLIGRKLANLIRGPK